MNKAINVLSLFDGISCGQIALNRAGINYGNYFASEVDKHAIAITQSNYGKTYQLGSVLDVQGKDLPRIDLLLGGSPCQGFSCAGEQLNFNDPRSKLFFEYVRLKQELQPTWFLMENVKMKQEYENIITNALGVQPMKINSAIVSAQSRERIYWTNIPFGAIPNKGIVLEDILDVHPADKLWVKDDQFVRKMANYGIKPGKYLYNLGYIRSNAQGNRVYSVKGKSPTLLAASGGIAGPANCLIKDGDRIRKLSIGEAERLQTLPVGYTGLGPDSHIRKAIGNGWTVDVISHILQGLK